MLIILISLEGNIYTKLCIAWTCASSAGVGSYKLLYRNVIFKCWSVVRLKISESSKL